MPPGDPRGLFFQNGGDGGLRRNSCRRAPAAHIIIVFIPYRFHQYDGTGQYSLLPLLSIIVCNIW